MRLPRRLQTDEAPIDIAARLAPHVAADVEPFVPVPDGEVTVELVPVPA